MTRPLWKKVKKSFFARGQPSGKILETHNNYYLRMAAGASARYARKTYKKYNDRELKEKTTVLFTKLRVCLDLLDKRGIKLPPEGKEWL